MAYRFDGKVAIITGAGGGLGFAYASYLAKHGCKVVINDLGGGTFGFDGKPNASIAEQAAQKIRDAGGEAMANAGSVSDKAVADKMVEAVIKKWGRIDIIINNAGIASTQVFPAVENEEVQMHLGVHVLGAINLMRAAWPHMVSQKSGVILNTASDSTLGFSPQISYPSMKSALFGLSKSLALLGRDNGIRVNVILPAAFTRLSALLPACDFRDHLEKDFQPDRLAPVISYLCHESCDINGEIFSVGGGRFARVMFASTPAVPVDMSMESVAAAMQPVMADKPEMFVLKSTFDDLKNLGFSDEECSIFYNMTATQGGNVNITPVAKQSLDNVWDITVKSSVGDQKSVLTLKSDGAKLLGNVNNDQYGMQTVFGGELKGETITWKTKITKPVPMTLTYTGSADKDDVMVGKVKLGMFGEAPFVAKPASAAVKDAAAKRFADQLANPQQAKGFIGKLLGRILGEPA
jgi:NAD(P)-dependent dehydrogenase (short-subunit alcohol dehydrogenase family)